MKPVENYFRSLHDIHISGAGVTKAAYYPPLVTLLNEAGQGLKPRVRCLLNLKNINPNLPDGGLFTADQFPKTRGTGNSSPLPATPPSRGAVEVLDIQTDLQTIAHYQPLENLLKKYRQALVTNYWSFSLIGLDANEQPVELESYSLAEGETDFWNQVVRPAYLAKVHGDRLVEYLKRVMLYAAPLVRPEEIALFLASYAREANHQLENVTLLAEDPVQATTLLQALDRIRLSLETSLDLTFEGERGYRFFQTMLVQTLFYALFSAWLLWHYEDPDRQDQFDWRLTHWYLRLPLIHALFRQLTQTELSGAQALEMEETLNSAGDLLNRVERTEFFRRFTFEQVMEGFCEPFLLAFSPQLRKEYDLWYTPPETANYMVAKVDWALREELGIPDGLANEQVVVLDSCCGTGAYLVAVLQQIHTTLQQKGETESNSYHIKKAALRRLFGFELIPASFVIAHLQLALLLHQLDMPFTPTERPRIYLSNALTGWAEAKKITQKEAISLPELQAEREAAQAVKQNQKILVILGHLPHLSFPNLTVASEQNPGYDHAALENSSASPRAAGLHLHFLHLAEQIVGRGGRGVICAISKDNWLDQPDHIGLRRRFLESFDQIWVDSLNGGKTRSGQPDSSVFSSRSNREGSQDLAIVLLIRHDLHQPAQQIHFRNLWGKAKLTLLPENIEQGDAGSYEKLNPTYMPELQFRPQQKLPAYLTWPLLPDLFSVFFPTFNDKRKDLLALAHARNLFLICRKRADYSLPNPPFYVASLLSDRFLVRLGGACFPITLKGYTTPQQSLFDQLPGRAPANLSAEAQKYLLAIGIKNPDEDEETSSLIAGHILAIGYSPLYLSENQSLLQQDWPHIPLPENEIAIRKSAALGQKIAALLNLDIPVSGVTNGPIRPELKTIATLNRVDDVELDPETDLALTTAWQNVSPDQSQLVERDYLPAERAAIEKGAATLGLSLDQLDHYFGLKTCDIYLNELVCWANIPLKVWGYRIGGYQVIRQWLSQREMRGLGRSLKLNEAQELTSIARRITAIILMEPALDANYRAIKQSTYSWSTTK